MMTELVLEAIEKYKMNPGGKKLLVALSGGADSTALLRVMHSLAPRLDATVCAAHLNHRLRGREADADENFCRELCKKLGIELFVRSLDIAELSQKEGVSVELCARNARYGFFSELIEKENIDLILTAHTASDNLETVLFNLTRSSGARGLAGIPPVRENIIRPLILATREDVEQYLKELGQDYVTDRTNFENEYSRNKIRNLVIPRLKEINPEAERSAMRAASAVREDCEFIDMEAKRAQDEMKGGLICSKITSLSRPIASRIVMAAAEKAGARDLSMKNVDDILKICAQREHKSLDLPGFVKAEASMDRLTFSPQKKGKDDIEYVLSVGCVEEKEEIITPSGYKITLSVCERAKKSVVHRNLMTAFVDYDKITWPVEVRSRCEGDAYRPYRAPGRRTVKKMMIEKRIPVLLRSRLPLFVTRGEIFYCAGLDISHSVCVTNESKKILVIEVTTNE